MSLEDASMAEQFRRFARPRREEPYSEAALRAPIIHIYDVPGGQHLHWKTYLKVLKSRPPKCPSCGVECCLGHPDNGCELRDVYDVSMT